MDDERSPLTTGLSWLREQAAAFRKLAEQHHAAGNDPIAAKLLEVAAEHEAKAAGPSASKSEAVPPALSDGHSPDAL